MKFKSLLLVSALILFAFALQAQEEQPINEPSETTHRDINLDEGKTLNGDHMNTHAVSPRDSIMAAQRAVQPNSSRAGRPEAGRGARKEKESEDALSFNFLYYMIQKFKLQDLIDE